MYEGVFPADREFRSVAHMVRELVVACHCALEADLPRSDGVEPDALGKVRNEMFTIWEDFSSSGQASPGETFELRLRAAGMLVERVALVAALDFASSLVRVLSGESSKSFHLGHLWKSADGEQ